MTKKSMVHAINENPHFAGAFINRRIILAGMGYYDQASADFTKALEFDKFHAAACYDQGIACYDMSAIPKVLSNIEKALELNPENRVNHRAKTLLETRLENFNINH